MAKTKVSIVKTSPKPGYAEIRKAVEKALDLIGGVDDLFKPGKTVLLNPSWVAPPTETEKGCITQPEVTQALADIVMAKGARAIIAESSAVGVDTQKVIDGSGYKALKEKGYEIVDLKKTPVVTVHVPNGVTFKQIEVFKPVMEADVIVSIPKMKTHDQTEITVSIKKLKGLLSDKFKRAMHQEGLFEGVIDLMSVVKPQLAVVDGIYCQEGLGPIFGKPVEMDLILASRDLVAADAVSGLVMDFKPEDVLLTMTGAKRGLGVYKPQDIEVVGEKVEKVKRRFLRSSEDIPVKVEGFNLIYGGVTCTGCRNTVLSAIVDMKNADQLVYLPGVTVITGDPEISPFAQTDRVVAVGKCVPEAKRGKYFVPGCPPNNSYVVQGIIGDRAKAKRMYGDGGDLDKEA